MSMESRWKEDKPTKGMKGEILMKYSISKFFTKSNISSHPAWGKPSYESEDERQNQMDD